MTPEEFMQVAQMRDEVGPQADPTPAGYDRLLRQGAKMRTQPYAPTTRPVPQSYTEWYRQGRERPGLTAPDILGTMVGETPGEVAFNLALGPFGRGVRLAGLAGSALFGSGEAEGAGAGALKTARQAVLNKLRGGGRTAEMLESRQAPTVVTDRKPQFPGVYSDPVASAKEAEKRIAPESPNVTLVYGPEASREALAATNLKRGPGITDPREIVPGWVNNPRGSQAAHDIMTPENAERIFEQLHALRTHAPQAWQSGLAWYMGDPKYKAIERLVGPEEAQRLYRQHTVFQGVESPELSPPMEIRRGANAMFFAEQGGPEEFAGRYMTHGGKPPSNRARSSFLPEMENVPGRKGQMNAAYPQYQFMTTGQAGTQGPKVWPYVLSHGVPETGFQNIIPVADAHYIRSLGLPDTRNLRWNKEKGLFLPDATSIYTPELQTLYPWYRDVVGQLGLKPGQAQPIQWVGMAHHTGVKPPYGASKIEMEADRIVQQAKKHGEPVEKVRDEFLLGKRHLGALGGPGMLPLMLDRLRENEGYA